MSYSFHGYQGQNGHNGSSSSQLSDTVKFEKNIPVRVSLKYDKPRIVNGRWGDRAMFTLTDGRVMFVDPDVAESIRTIGIQPGQEFIVCQRSANGRTEWEVSKLPERPPQPAATMAMGIDETDLERDLRLSIQEAERKKAATAAAANPYVTVHDGRPKTKLEDALKTVVAAVHAAQEYAKTIGYQMPPFSSEDIRTMANTLIIDGQRSNHA